MLGQVYADSAHPIRLDAIAPSPNGVLQWGIVKAGGYSAINQGSKRRWVGFALEISFQASLEYSVIGSDLSEQGHRRPELHFVRTAKNILGANALQTGDDPAAFPQPRSEDGMRQVS